MNLLSNHTKTICFFSLSTDLEKTFICIQYYYYLQREYPDKKAIILYDGLDNTYYRQLVFSKKNVDVRAESITGKHAIVVEDYLEFDIIIFDISQQNYNIYESFLYNSQLVLIVNNDLDTVHSKELELTKTVHKEVINEHDGLKLFPVDYCNLVLNNFHFAMGNSQKKYNDLLSEVEDNNFAEISGILTTIEDKEITTVTDDVSYELLFTKIDAILFPTLEDEDDELIYGDTFHTAK